MSTIFTRLNRELAIQTRGRIDDHEIERAGCGDLHDGAREIGRRRAHDEQPLEIDPRLRDRRSIERRSIRFGDPCAPSTRIRGVHGANGGERDGRRAAAHRAMLRDARGRRRCDLDDATRQPAIRQHTLELGPVEREDSAAPVRGGERVRPLEHARLAETRERGRVQTIEDQEVRRHERCHTEQVTST